MGVPGARVAPEGQLTPRHGFADEIGARDDAPGAAEGARAGIATWPGRYLLAKTRSCPSVQPWYQTAKALPASSTPTRVQTL